MNATFKSELLAIGRNVLYAEAASLDERRWDDWLALYSPECEFWMPTWRTEDDLTENAQTEMSHIYYASRAGLEDRVVRIRTRRSPASSPMPRTAHIVGYIVLDSKLEDHSSKATSDIARFSVHSSWSCHVFYPHLQNSQVFFGLAYYILVREMNEWRIGAKRTVLQNDYIPTMLDIYCI
jgi:3-phenylpropionate/cinnamic acid dioxygenase small subunit